MTPETAKSNLGEVLQIAPIASLTYCIQADKKRIQGEIDEIDAMKQAIHKILFTERYRHEIYDWNYGIALSDLFGKSKSYAIPELEKRIREALLADDRILDVTDFSFSSKKNELTVTFCVYTTFGTISGERKVEL